MNRPYPKNRKSRAVEDRFFEKVSATLGCWAWTGGTTPAGYGCFWIEGRQVGAHVVVYILAWGPIPDGLEIDHLCENKGCVCPHHLEAVTHTENVRRAKARRWTQEKRAANAAAMNRDPSTGRLV